MITNNLQKRLKKLNLSKKELSKKLANVLEVATVNAITKATELTPPSIGDNKVRGVGMITGAAKSAWAKDSIAESYIQNDKHITVLANKQHYISFLNDGHILEKHFVPGLIINKHNNLIEKAPAGLFTGIVVGNKTTYIKGLYMREAALKVFDDTLNKTLPKTISDIFKDKK